MEPIDLLKICKEFNNIICYGAGINAKDLTVFFKSNDVEIVAYCISNPNEKVETIDNKPIIGVKDIKNYSDAVVVVGVSSKYHDEIRENLERQNIKDVVYIDDDMAKKIVLENTKTGWRARGYILYNTPLNNEELENANEEYEQKIKKMKERFSHIEIKNTTGYSIGALTESLCYYSDMDYNDNVFFLLYPSGCLPDGTTYFRKFMYANQFVLRAFKGDFYETICDKNLMFWKYFIKNYPEMFVDKLDDEFWIKYKKDKLENTRKGLVGTLGKQYINFTEAEEAKGQKILAEWNVTAPYICFNCRDAAYVRDEIGNTELYRDWANAFRNSDINNFRLLCEELKKIGINTVRIGSRVDTTADFPGCVDYANKFRSPFMDVYINANCKFVIGDSSGIQSFASLAGKPIVMLNVCQVGTNMLDPINPLFFERDLLIMKKLWDPNRKRYLTLREIIRCEQESTRRGIEFRHLWEFYHEKGIVPIENTPEEILDVALEMNSRLDGSYEYDSLDEELQQKYIKIAGEVNKNENWYWFPLRMGAKFLRQNQWLLD